MKFMDGFGWRTSVFMMMKWRSRKTNQKIFMYMCIYKLYHANRIYISVHQQWKVGRIYLLIWLVSSNFISICVYLFFLYVDIFGIWFVRVFFILFRTIWHPHIHKEQMCFYSTVFLLSKRTEKKQEHEKKCVFNVFLSFRVMKTVFCLDILTCFIATRKET